MFEANNKDIKTTSMTSSGVFIVKFEHILQIVQVLLLLNLNKQMVAGYRMPVQVN